MPRALPVAAVLLACACAHAPGPAPFDPHALYDDAAFRPVAVAPEPGELFALPADAVARFRAEVELRERRVGSRREAFVAVVQELYAGFLYGDATARAADVLAQRRGNCLGLALLTAAFARELRVPYVFREVLAPPAWDRRNGVTLVSRHVNVWVFDLEDPEGLAGADVRHLALGKTASIIDFFPMSRSYPASYLEDDRVVAMFYGNLAAEALVGGGASGDAAGDPDAAYALARQAVAVDPGFADGWNLLGLVYGRRGHPLAEPAYRRALALAPNDATVLNDFSLWLEREGRGAEAAAWAARVEGAREGNPFTAFDRAETAFGRRDYRTAAALYGKAAAADPYQHEFQFGLFRACWMQGERDRALEALRRAIRIAEDGETEARYERKLMALGGAAER